MQEASLSRIALLIIVGVLLNLGLFFMLVFFAPLVAGLVVGFLLEKVREGGLVGFVGAVLGNYILLIVSEFLEGFPTDPLVILSAILIMGLVGMFGGLLGTFVRLRSL